MSHVPANLTQPAEPPTEPQHDLKPVYDSISTLSRQELPPGAHLPIMQAHPQIRKPPILSDAVQHVTACMAHESARMDNEARALKPRVSPPKQAPHPLPSTLPLHNSCFRTTCHRFLINGPISARTKLNELQFPNPFSIAKRKAILQSPVPDAPDSSARIGDCRKAYDKPADVIFFSWPYHYPCIAMAKIIGRADFMSRYDLSQRVHRGT